MPTSIDVPWAVAATLLALFMHAGFALVTTGLCRAKNASHTMSMNLMVYALGMTGFFICGYALMSGGYNWGDSSLPSRWLIQIRGWGFAGGRGFFLSGQATTALAAIACLFMLLRINVAATIPLGTLAERWSFKSFFFVTLILAGVVFPIYACWVWGGGWIWRLGGRDYAGASVVHLQGGMIALAGARILGPRVGKYDLRGRPRPILGHNVPMAILGTLFLTIGGLALNGGAAILDADGMLGTVMINSLLASAAGAMAACCYMWSVYGKPDPSMTCNGMLGGLVAISAACAYVSPGIAFLIGALAGLLVARSVFFWERRGIDDPVGAISVHGVNGLWGIIALGLFANGGGVSPVKGLFFGNARQLLDQGIMAGACCAWNLISAWIILRVVGKFAGANRVPREVELAGLDIPEMGVPAYQDINTNAASPQTGLRALGTEPRPASMPIDGQRRYSMVIEGIAAGELIKVWSTLCQIGAEPPSEEFRAVYPFVTTVTGNRFRFRGGDPAVIKENLNKLFQSALKSDAIQAKMEA